MTTRNLILETQTRNKTLEENNINLVNNLNLANQYFQNNQVNLEGLEAERRRLN